MARGKGNFGQDLSALSTGPEVPRAGRYALDSLPSAGGERGAGDGMKRGREQPWVEEQRAAEF